jgi:hypothetical protein
MRGEFMVLNDTRFQERSKRIATQTYVELIVEALLLLRAAKTQGFGRVSWTPLQEERNYVHGYTEKYHHRHTPPPPPLVERCKGGKKLTPPHEYWRQTRIFMRGSDFNHFVYSK